VTHLGNIAIPNPALKWDGAKARCPLASLYAYNYL